MDKQMNTKELVDAINQWGLDRNITADGGATPGSQMSKMVSELSEFMANYDALWIASYQDKDTVEEQKVLLDKLDDDIGDMLVCLIQVMRLLGTDMEKCLQRAWDDIKDRKGTMINGQFVKEKE